LQQLFNIVVSMAT